MIWMLLIATWEAGYRVIGWNTLVFPAPSQVLDGMMSLMSVETRFGDALRPNWPWPVSETRPFTGSWYEIPLVEAIFSSLARLGVGFAISIVIGGFIGAACWRYKWFDEFIGPVLLGVQTLPSVCWVPLAILIMGFKESGILFVLVIGSFSAIAISLRDGLRAIPPLYQQAGRMMGANGLKLYIHVLLPASLPALATSLRQGFSFAWRSLMGGELILSLSPHGLGHRLEIARNLSAVETVVGLLIVMILIGMLADRLVFAQIQKRVAKRFGFAPAGN